MDWVLIKKWGPEPIGAIGFLKNKAVVVAAFYDDRDGNKDGKVSFGEWLGTKLSPISVEGSAVVEVAMQARVEMDVMMRDPTFAQEAANLFLSFAGRAVLDGVYAVYFKRGVSMAGKGVAKMVTDSMIKQMVIRKGFNEAVKEAFDQAVGAAS